MFQRLRPFRWPSRLTAIYMLINSFLCSFERLVNGYSGPTLSLSRSLNKDSKIPHVNVLALPPCFCGMAAGVVIQICSSLMVHATRIIIIKYAMCGPHTRLQHTDRVAPLLRRQNVALLAASGQTPGYWSQ